MSRLRPYQLGVRHLIRDFLEYQVDVDEWYDTRAHFVMESKMLVDTRHHFVVFLQPELKGLVREGQSESEHHLLSLPQDLQRLIVHIGKDHGEPELKQESQVSRLKACCAQTGPCLNAG